MACEESNSKTLWGFLVSPAADVSTWSEMTSGKSRVNVIHHWPESAKGILGCNNIHMATVLGRKIRVCEAWMPCLTLHHRKWTVKNDEPPPPIKKSTLHWFRDGLPFFQKACVLSMCSGLLWLLKSMNMAQRSWHKYGWSVDTATRRNDLFHGFESFRMNRAMSGMTQLALMKHWLVQWEN